MSRRVAPKKVTHLGKIDFNHFDGRWKPAVFNAHVASFEALAEVQFPTARSVLFLGADAAGVGVDPISLAAKHLLDSGLVYLCAWGDDCERVHDIFDETLVGDGEGERELGCVTTWHSGDTLEQAIEFFMSCARPQEDDFATTAFIAVSLGDRELSTKVRNTIAAAENFLPL